MDNLNDYDWKMEYDDCIDYIDMEQDDYEYCDACGSHKCPTCGIFTCFGCDCDDDLYDWDDVEWDIINEWEEEENGES